jgi:hypothetical protein
LLAKLVEVHGRRWRENELARKTGDSSKGKIDFIWMQVVLTMRPFEATCRDVKMYIRQKRSRIT